MQTFLETGIPETLKLKGEVDAGTAKGIVEIVVSEDPTRNSYQPLFRILTFPRYFLLAIE